MHELQKPKRRRLRQLVSISARSVTTTKQDQATFFTLSILNYDTNQFHLIYISEYIKYTLNPEWRSLPQDLCPPFSSPEQAAATTLQLSIYQKESYTHTHRSGIEHDNPFIFAPGTEPLYPSSDASIQKLSLVEQALRAAHQNNTPHKDSITCIASYNISLDRLPTFGTQLSSIPFPVNENSLILEFTDGEYSLFPLHTTAQQWEESHIEQPEERIQRKDNIDIATVETACHGLSSAAASNDNTIAFIIKPDDTQPKHTRTASSTSSLPPVTQTTNPHDNTIITDTDNATNTNTAQENANGIRLDMDDSTGDNKATRAVSVSTLRHQVATLIGLQKKVMYLQSRCHAMHAVIDRYYIDSAPAREQRDSLHAVHAELKETQRMHSAILHRAADVDRSMDHHKRCIAVQSQALVTTLQALQTAHKRVKDAETSLEGDDGMKRLSDALKNLLFRRCWLVAHAGSVYRLGSSAVQGRTVHSAAVLDDAFDVMWAGGIVDDNDDRVLAGTSTQGSAASARNASDDSGRTSTIHAPTSSKPKPTTTTMRFSIGSIDLNPAVWRHAFDPEGYAWDPAEDKKASVALGYVAHLVNRTAWYLGVDLRYPIVFRGSTSVIYDNYPLAGDWSKELEELFVKGISTGQGKGNSAYGYRAHSNTDHGNCSSSAAGARGNGTCEGSGGASLTSYLFGGYSTSGVPDAGGGSMNSAKKKDVQVTPVEYPLYCESNRERPRFAVGVFLLNKDVIQLLQVHGMTAFGPNMLLQNLYKLVAAGRSGLPPGIEKQYDVWRG